MIYEAKCKDQSIQPHKRIWELFLKTFRNKNQMEEGHFASGALDLENLSLGNSSLPYINNLFEYRQF